MSGGAGAGARLRPVAPERHPEGLGLPADRRRHPGQQGSRQLPLIRGVKQPLQGQGEGASVSAASSYSAVSEDMESHVFSLCSRGAAGGGVLHPGAVRGWRSEPESRLLSSQLPAGQWSLVSHIAHFLIADYVSLRGQTQCNCLMRLSW